MTSTPIFAALLAEYRNNGPFPHFHSDEDES